VALAGALAFALRRLLALSHRLNQLGEFGSSDPERVRRAVQDEVDRYNRSAPDDEKLK
jgi:hypothetical protein